MHLGRLKGPYSSAQTSQTESAFSVNMASDGFQAATTRVMVTTRPKAGREKGKKGRAGGGGRTI